MVSLPSCPISLYLTRLVNEYMWLLMLSVAFGMRFATFRASPSRRLPPEVSQNAFSAEDGPMRAARSPPRKTLPPCYSSSKAPV